MSIIITIIAIIAIYAVLYTVLANVKDSKEDWAGEWEYHPLMARLDREAERSPVARMLRELDPKWVAYQEVLAAQKKQRAFNEQMMQDILDSGTCPSCQPAFTPKKG